MEWHNLANVCAFPPKQLILAAMCHVLITMNIQNEIEELFQHDLNS